MNVQSIAKRIRDNLLRGPIAGESLEVKLASHLTAKLIGGLQLLERERIYKETGELVSADEKRPLSVFLIDADGDLRMRINLINKRWRRIIEEQVSDNPELATDLRLYNKNFTEPAVISLDIAGLKLMIAPGIVEDSALCAFCGMVYQSSVNATRCRWSHTKKYESTRYGLYSRDELREFWDALDEVPRRAILATHGLPLPRDVMCISGNALLENLAVDSEYTHLFKVTSQPASLSFDSDDDDDDEMDQRMRDMRAMAADRTIHALVDALEQHKEQAIVKFLEDENTRLREEDEKREKKRLARLEKRIARLEKRIFSPEFRLGWEE